MKIYRKEKRVFKKGEKYHLDEVYNIIVLFPVESDAPFYHQDDIADIGQYGTNTSRDGTPNDFGEYIKILRNFTIEYSIKI